MLTKQVLLQTLCGVVKVILFILAVAIPFFGILFSAFLWDVYGLWQPLAGVAACAIIFMGYRVGENYC